MKALRRSLLVLALAAPALFATAAPAVAQSPVPAVTSADRTLGRADAPVTVIEYASFTCHHCSDWHLTVFPTFKQRLIDTGQVRFVFRNLPTGPISASLPAAAMARCAAPERFFDVTAALMRGQAAVLGGGAQQDWYAPAIAASGRTVEQLTACANDPATRAAIEGDVDGAVAAGVQGTPAFFVNGQRVEDRSLAGLEAAVRAAR